jgi:hypothetical protein
MLDHKSTIQLDIFWSMDNVRLLQMNDNDRHVHRQYPFNVLRLLIKNCAITPNAYPLEILHVITTL